MPFVPFGPGVVEADFQMTLSGIPVEITQGYRLISGAASPIDGASLGAVLSGWWNTELSTNLNVDCTLVNIQINDLTSAAGWQANVFNGTAGSQGGTVLPNQVAMTVTFETASRGRSYRGRNYVPGLIQADLQNPYTFNAARVAGINSVYNNLQSVVAAAGWQSVVLSRVAGGVPRVLGVTTPIVNIRANAPLATIRGRLT